MAVKNCIALFLVSNVLLAPVHASNPRTEEPTAEQYRAALINKMKSITIPELRFEGAKIQDIVWYLSSASYEYHRDANPPFKHGVTFALILPEENEVVVTVGGGNQNNAIGGEGNRYASLHTVLNKFIQAARMKYILYKTIVIILPPDMELKPAFIPPPADETEAVQNSEAIEAKMKNIVLPITAFRNAQLHHIVEFFIDASKEYDDYNLPPKNRGIHFMLDLPEDENVPPVYLFNARYENLHTLFNTIMMMTQMQYTVRGNTVVITPAKKELAP